MAFASNGTLYAVTGDGSGVAESLYILNIQNGTSTFVTELAAGSDGETIAYNPDDAHLYHASGIGTPNHPNGERFEKIDPITLAITNIPLSGFDYEELTALTYVDGGFFAGDLGSSTTDAPRFFRITPGGAVTLLGTMDHVSKGLVLAAPREPVPGLTTPSCVLLFACLALVGQTGIAQARRRADPSSIEAGR